MNFRKLFIYFLALTVFLNTLFWALAIPYNDAPDEYTHFEVSQFIAFNNRFPVFGQDENMGVSKYEKPNFRAFYNASYSIMPPLAYIFQALAIKIIPGIDQANAYLSARISSVILSFFYVLVVFKLAKILFSGFYKQISFVFLSIFIPQITFTFSYVNSDAMALFLSAILFYYLVLLIKGEFEINLKNSLLLGVLSGFTVLTRYNVFILFPFIGFFYLKNLRQIKNFKNKIKLGSVLCISAFLVSGWWYIRNLIVYQDLFGNRKFWETVYMLYPPSNIGKGFYTIFYILFKTNWLWESFKSFWAGFGWNYIFLKENFYRLLLLISFGGFLGSLKQLKKQSNFKQKILTASFLLFIFSLVLSLWQSWKFAFQAQGRYFFPVLPAIAFIIINGLFGISRDKLYNIGLFLFICFGTLFLNIVSLISYIIPAYY